MIRTLKDSIQRNTTVVHLLYKILIAHKHRKSKKEKSSFIYAYIISMMKYKLLPHDHHHLPLIVILYSRLYFVRPRIFQTYHPKVLKCFQCPSGLQDIKEDSFFERKYLKHFCWTQQIHMIIFLHKSHIFKHIFHLSTIQNLNRNKR